MFTKARRSSLDLEDMCISLCILHHQFLLQPGATAYTLLHAMSLCMHIALCCRYIPVMWGQCICLTNCVLAMVCTHIHRYKTWFSCKSQLSFKHVMHLSLSHLFLYFFAAMRNALLENGGRGIFSFWKYDRTVFIDSLAKAPRIEENPPVRCSALLLSIIESTFMPPWF